jgi:hypothetical protein
MTQTATFPNLESIPNVSTQAILYFSSTMGTLTEVDLTTSGSFSTEFSAENLGSSSATIKGVTGGNLAINVPTGAIPVSIPSVSESFAAQAFDGTVDNAGPSGKDFAPVTSNSAPQTTVLTSPVDLAAFTGNFRIPITVSGHASGTATSTNGDLSAGFKTQTAATLTVVYHYLPNLPSLDPPPASGPASQPPSPPSTAPATVPAANPAPAPTTAPPGAATAAVPPGASTPVQVIPTHPDPKRVQKKEVVRAVKPAIHKVVTRPKTVGHSVRIKTHPVINVKSHVHHKKPHG